MNKEEREEIKDNPLSKIVFLNDDEELYSLSRLFLQIPYEYGAMGVVGKKYEAIKDYLRWNGFSLKEWTWVVVKMGEIWARNAKK